MSETDTGAAGGGENIAVDMKTVETMVAEHQATEAQKDAARINDFFNGSGLPSSDAVGVEVRQFVDGTKPISRELYDAVQAKVSGWAHDKEFQRKLMSGDREAARLLAIS